MAAAGADKLSDAKLQEKKGKVHRMVSEALGALSVVIAFDILELQEKIEVDVVFTLSRNSVVYFGGSASSVSFATPDDWMSVLSNGLGTTFTIDWDHTRYSTYDLRVLRLGERIFDVMRSRGLNPEWDGTRAGDFTITAVDEAGAKLALAMALHPRLGTEWGWPSPGSTPPSSDGDAFDNEDDQHEGYYDGVPFME
ncbi:hypothetical protein T484DRAFT_1760786 [Baffinella frigidus]|nr:hypothetical protein T484DRAFT_1760786 [Cryptophyta sp. CCMP2293]